MPTPFYHLSVAEALLENSGYPTGIQILIKTHHLAFLLGHVAPDVQVISGQTRERTHFYNLPTEANDQPPWERFLNEYSSLGYCGNCDPELAVFLTGYLCHLQADWFWVKQIFEPYFGPDAKWKTFRERLYLHNVLRSYLDYQVLESLKNETRLGLTQADPKAWLTFVKVEHLESWREFLANQLKPGAPIQTVEVFASRQGISVENYYRLLKTEDQMQQNVFDFLPRKLLKVYWRELLTENVNLLIQYLENFGGIKMQIQNFSEIKTIDGKLSLQDRFQGILKYGFSWPKDLNAQDEFTATLQRDVDTRSTLIRDFALPEVEVTVPFILVGPPGIRVILLTRIRGMFRAKEGQWLIHTGKGFRPAKENIIHRTQLYIKATQKFIDDLGFHDVIVDGLIVGVNPGMHVETHHSVVRVIQSDAIRRFGSQWDQDPPEISPEQIYQIVSTITSIGKPEMEGDVRAPFAEPKKDKFAESLEPLHKTFDFSSKQWAIVGVLIAATVCVLLIFILFIILFP